MEANRMEGNSKSGRRDREHTWGVTAGCQNLLLCLKYNLIVVDVSVLLENVSIWNRIHLKKQSHAGRALPASTPAEIIPSVVYFIQPSCKDLLLSCSSFAVLWFLGAAHFEFLWCVFVLGYLSQGILRYTIMMPYGSPLLVYNVSNRVRQSFNVKCSAFHSMD